LLLNHFRSLEFFGHGIVPFLLTPPELSHANIALIKLIPVHRNVSIF
jgi:hypothetical protein